MENKILLLPTPETMRMVDIIARFVGNMCDASDVKITPENMMEFLDSRILRVIVNPDTLNEFFVDALLSEVTGEITIMDECDPTGMV